MMVVEIIQLNNDHFQGIIYTVTQHLNEQTMQTNKPPLSLPHHAHQQGGFLPCKQQKAWKKTPKNIPLHKESNTHHQHPTVCPMDYPSSHPTTTKPHKCHHTTPYYNTILHTKINILILESTILSNSIFKELHIPPRIHYNILGIL